MDRGSALRLVQPAPAPPVLCRASIAAIDGRIPGDKEDAIMALVITAAVDVPIRVPLSRKEAENLFRAIGSMF